MNRFDRKTILIAAGVLLLALLWGGYHFHARHRDDPATSIALLISDQVSAADPMVTVWADAAREEGLRVEILSISEFLRPSLKRASQDYAGVILPDAVAQSASTSFIQRITEYVQAGGKLMLVYDAATHNAAGVYYPEKAPLSRLAGIDYALYDSLRDDTTVSSPVCGEAAAFAGLRMPPGRYMAVPEVPVNPSGVVQPCIVGYQYGALEYSSYATRGAYAGKRLLSTSAGGIIAGYRPHEKGGVLFINLPLGYLKGQTDGILLHSFLRYFAGDILGLPSLSAAPNGVGGLIFNWHVDSNAAIAPIMNLDQSGILRQGPFSIHFTAGPDARASGDGLGLDLAHNPSMQQWIKRFKERGDALGNHGGWIHDYFGLNVTEDNQAQMEKYLEMNNQAVATANGAPVREYSAPVGTQPKWVTAWLEAHGFTAYYFTGNGGMAPTRSYRDGKLWTRKIWSFPVLGFGKVTSFEEAADNGIGEQEMGKWLQDISDFAAESGSIRMFYSHPPGFQRYSQSMAAWFRHTQTLLDRKRFSWYTMSQIADFLNRRELTDWRMKKTDGGLLVEAEHPDGLEQLAWRFPKSTFEKPVVQQGEATVGETETDWLLVAKGGKILRIAAKNHERIVR